MPMFEAACFNPPAWPPEYAHLQNMIGLGRCAQTTHVSLWLSLRLKHSESGASPLLPIELVLEGKSVCAWVEETAFAQWLEPILPIPNLAALAAEMRCAAGAWMLAPWLDWCAQQGLSVPTLKMIGEAQMLSPALSGPMCTVLTLVSNRADATLKRLDLVLTGFSESWLGALANSMRMHPEPGVQLRRINVRGTAGFARLSVRQLTELRVGDVIFAAAQALLSEGRLFCYVGSLFFQARQIDQNRFEVEHIMTAFDEEAEMASDTVPCVPESTVADVPITLVFEMGRMSVPLSQLVCLKVGDVLETELMRAPDIGIRAQGKLIAAAKLVRMGERLGVQITQIMNAGSEQETRPEGLTQVDPWQGQDPDNLSELDGTDPL